MDTVMRRGPWAFDDRMLVLLKWTLLMELELLNFIMFLIQVRGIPLQFMNHEVIHHIVRAMGEYIQMEYNEEAGGRWNFSDLWDAHLYWACFINNGGPCPNGGDDHNEEEKDLKKEEMYNLIPNNHFGVRGEIEHDLKKKAWIDEANGSKSRFARGEKEESSGNNGIERKKGYTSQSSDEDADEKINDESEQRGAVGP
ncbi:uncharacterized protein LOC125608546 [Brassica napus]|nr:uncharacterized protein LOC125608546 [Brassica napus]